MDVSEVIDGLAEDVTRIDRAREDLERQVIGLHSKRDTLDKEKAEIQSAIAVFKRKLASMSLGAGSAAAGLSDADIVRELVRSKGGRARTPQLQEALETAGRIPTGAEPWPVAAAAVKAAGLITDGRGWWRLSDAAVTSMPPPGYPAGGYARQGLNGAAMPSERATAQESPDDILPPVPPG